MQVSGEEARLQCGTLGDTGREDRGTVLCLGDMICISEILNTFCCKKE